MSSNQSRADKSGSSHYKKFGRSGSSGQQKNFLGDSGKGGGGGTAPPPSSSSLSSNQSFKKSNNAQGGQSRASGASANSDSSNVSAAHTVQNSVHLQQPFYRVSDAPAAGINVKPADVSAQKSTPVIPKVPSSNTASVSPGTAAPATPSKVPGDASRSFPLQFGSISPSFMNGMQIPARTSSAPPNLDEQNRDQARDDSSRAAPTLPTPAPPKQQLPMKDVGTVDQSSAVEARLVPQGKRDAQAPAASRSSQTQKPSVRPIPGISMQMPFHQPPVPVQFGGPNSQIQSMTASSIPMPLQMQMPLPMGNPPQVQQQVFVPGLQSHPMQSQGFMHQGQSLNFSSPMGSQLPPQLVNLGMSMNPKFSQQQGGKLGGLRKPVKITHPDTHEELRLDNKRSDMYMDGGSLGPTSHTHVPPQSQPVQSFPPTHPINYYPNSYNANSLFFRAPSSVSLNTQITPTSQAPRFYNQVTVRPAGVPHGEKVVDSSSSPPVQEGESLERLHGEAESIYPARDSEFSYQNSLQQSKLRLESMSEATKQSVVASGSVSTENPMSNLLHAATAAANIENSATLGANSSESTKKETVSMPDAIRDQQKNPGKTEPFLPQNQVGGQYTSASSLPSGSLEHCNFLDSGISDTVGAKTTSASSGNGGMVLESARESPSSTDASDSKITHVGESITCKSSEISDTEIKIDASLREEPSKPETVETKEGGELLLPGGSKQDENGFDTSSGHISLKSSEIMTQTEQSSQLNLTTTSYEGMPLNAARRKLEEPVGGQIEDDRVVDNLVASIAPGSDVINAETSPSSVDLSTVYMGDENSTFNASISRQDSISKEAAGTKFGMLVEPASASIPSISETTLKCDAEGIGNSSNGFFSPSASGSKDKPLLEPDGTKNTVAKKKKRKEMLQKANRAATTSDLYTAYKGPEEKKESIMSAESTESDFGISLKLVHSDASQEDVILSEKSGQSKAEPDDWEDAADISTPKLETSDNGKHGDGRLKHNDEDGNGVMAKKYSRDFLLKFAEQCTDLPEDLEFRADTTDILMVSNINVSRDSYPSPGRITDRPMGGARPDRSGSGMGDDERWSKFPGPLASGRDMRLDISYGGNVLGFRPAQGGNYGVLRNPRSQTPIQYAGGILSGPMQSLGPQGGIQRNSMDSDRWQRGTAFQKGLIPSPQTPLQVMHKAKTKYEVGKVADEEQAKQRQLKAILNKLTPQNFEKLFEQVKQVNIDNAVTLTGVISQIFDKALMEPTFCEMYADFCYHLAGELPDLSVDNEKITFKRLLLNKCQEEFERGEREQEEANRADAEGEAKQSEEEREEKRLRARRRMLGNIRLIGELYKKKMLTERIMHECMKKLLGQYQYPDEEDVEALCKLMSTIGEMIDHPKAKEHMDAYFDRMANMSNNMKLSSRVRFMLKDAIDLRKNKWQQRRKVEGPKKIEEVHRDAAQERQAQTSRLSRTPSISSSVRRGQPMDFASRGSNMPSSSSAQMVGFRGAPPQLRVYGAQDVRFEDRHSYDNRTLSVPLPQRSIGDDSITLGPQGGLARGMSIRGQPSLPSVFLADMPSPGDSKRMTHGLNGYSDVSEQSAYGSREDPIPRYMPERFVSPSAYDQFSMQDRSMNYGNRDTRNADHSFQRSLPTSPSGHGEVPNLTQNVPSEKVWPEEHLRDLSLTTIQEFYSARDEKEVALCIKDMNAPGFHPSMLSIWLTDSFERKDVERDLLAKLVINLARSRDGVLSQDQLIKGFEAVLATLEDAVNDAPRAAEYLGRIFANVILEDVIPFAEIGQLIYEGGEEQGRLVEVGLAAEVLGSILEIVKSERGDSVLNGIRTNSSLQLGKFRPPNSNRSWRLDQFI